MEIGHIDGNPLNNAASNLRYVTTAENIRQSVDRGHRGANRWNAKMTDERVRDARLMYEDGWTVKEIAAYLGVSESCIHHIIARRSWKQVA
jgi:DNA-binding NarL/FixJ family response regulator